MSYENDEAMRQQHIWTAERAIFKLYALAGWAITASPPGYIIFSDHVARVIECLKKEQCIAAVLPITTYLVNVPLFDGSGHTKASYTAPKPSVHIVKTAVDFLAWMGDAQALPALQRIASTQRNIPTLLQDELYEDARNNEEREHAKWAILMIQEVQSKGYRPCENCNGQGRYACRTCKGSDIVKKRLLLWKQDVICPACYGAMTIECNNCEGFGKLLPLL